VPRVGMRALVQPREPPSARLLGRLARAPDGSTGASGGHVDLE